jgi:hypothetical protein
MTDRAKFVDVPVDHEDLSTIARIDTENIERLTVGLAPANQAFTAFDISIRSHTDENFSFVPIYSTAAEFVSPRGILVGTARSDSPNGDLTTIPAGERGIFIVDVRSISEVRLRARCAAEGGTVSVYPGGQ